MYGSTHACSVLNLAFVEPEVLTIQPQGCYLHHHLYETVPRSGDQVAVGFIKSTQRYNWKLSILSLILRLCNSSQPFSPHWSTVNYSDKVLLLV